MCVLVLLLLVAVVSAAPQGYNYQLHVGPSDGTEITYEQLQLLQQLAIGHKQPQIIVTALQQHQHQTQSAVQSAEGTTTLQVPKPESRPEQTVHTQQVEVSHERVPHPTAGPQFEQEPQFQPKPESQPEQTVHTQQVEVSHERVPHPTAGPQFEQEPQFQPKPESQPEQTVHTQPVEVSHERVAHPTAGPQFEPQPQSHYQRTEQTVHTQQVEGAPERVPHPIAPEPTVPQFEPQPQSHYQRTEQTVHTQQVEVAHERVAHPIAPEPTVPHFEPQPQSHFQRTSAPAPVQLNKEFFYLSAPQEDFETPQDFQDQLSKIRKNLRVVFIKAPEQNGLEKAALQLAKETSNSQTAIYVLQKQHNAADLANQLQQIRTTSQHKPEVIFVKYRTPEEASHAQRTIQAQYEALDGPNHFNHEGVVPSHNFVGAIDIEPRKRPVAFSSSGEQSTANVITPVNKYLPASAKH